MIRPGFVRCVLPALLVVGLVALLVPGCGDDDPVDPGDPELSLALACNGGSIDLTLRNDGGPMTEDSRLVAVFNDGQRDTLFLRADAGGEATCRLSNVHGSVVVTDAALGLEASAGDCLADRLEALVAAIDLDATVPDPLGNFTALGCTYSVTVSNLSAASENFELIHTDNGPTIRYLMQGIQGDLELDLVTGGLLCPANLTGDLGIASLLVEAHILIDWTEEPPIVSFGATDVTITGLQVNLDGAIGGLVELFVPIFRDQLVAGLESGLASWLDSLTGSDPGSLVTPLSSCED